ncbi:MAG: hypothetical protein AABW52_05350, partial [Nanoarchaeota archaeon]
MKYTTQFRVIEFDYLALNEKEKELLFWLNYEFDNTSSWTAFAERTTLGIVEYSRRLHPGAWRNFWLYQIH